MERNKFEKKFENKFEKKHNIYTKFQDIFRTKSQTFHIPEHIPGEKKFQGISPTFGISRTCGHPHSWNPLIKGGARTFQKLSHLGGRGVTKNFARKGGNLEKGGG